MTLPMIDRLAALPFFSEADYLDLNPDVAQAGIPAAEHALRYAPGEEREMFRRERLARAWGEAVLATAGLRATETPDRSRSARGPSHGTPTLTVRVSSRSGPEEAAMAASLAEALTMSGMRVARADETSDPSADARLSIVVAPHVFFGTGLGRLWSDGDGVERSLMFNTAPIHDPAFRRALPYILRSRGLLDASPQIAHMFRMAGVPALHVRLSSPIHHRWLADRDEDHPLVQAMPADARGAVFDPAAWEGRSFDLSFFGRHSARRFAILRRHAGAFAERPCFLYVAQPPQAPLAEEVAWRRSFRIAGHISARSRLTLLLAEDEFPRFDWQRCIQAMASGSVVVSDMISPHPDYVVGTHLFRDDVRHLAELSRWLLDEPDGRRAALDARTRAFDVLGRSAGALAEDLCSFLSSISE